MAFRLGIKADLAQIWPGERGKREFPFLRRATRAGSFRKNLKGPERSRAALFLPHAIRQAALPVLPLQLLPERCCPLHGSAASSAWIAFKCIQENSSYTPTSEMLCWSRNIPQTHIPALALCCSSCGRDISCPAWALLLFAPPKAGWMLGWAGRCCCVLVTPFHQDVMTHLSGKVCSFFLGISLAKHASLFQLNPNKFPP